MAFNPSGGKPPFPTLSLSLLVILRVSVPPWQTNLIMSAQVQTSKAARVPPKTVEIQIKRRANPDAPQYWERFELPYRPNLNIISCLLEIQKHMDTIEGNPTTPPLSQMNCLEQVCGISTMVINGRARQ